MKSLFILPLLICLMGCTTADLVEKIHKPYKGGTVKYLNQGATYVINQRIQSAQSKMQQFCGGEYEVLREGENSEMSSLVAMQGMLVPTSSNFIYISFKCL